MLIDSLGSLIQGAANTIHTNVKFHQRYSGTSGDYYWFADDPFNTTVHYMRGDGAAYHAAGIALGGSKFTVDANGNITKINNVTTSFPSSQGAANTVWRNDGSGNLSSYTVTDNEHTPTATNGTNVSSSTPDVAHYIRVGNRVTIKGVINITCTSAGASSQIDLSLPVASNFANTGNAVGVMIENVSGVASPGHGTISADLVNDRIVILFTPRATGSLAYSYEYTYKII